MDSYLVLLRVGFTLPHLLPDAVRSYRTFSPFTHKKKHTEAVCFLRHFP